MDLLEKLMAAGESTGWLSSLGRDGQAYHFYVYADIGGQKCLQISRGQFLPRLLIERYPACIAAMQEALEASAHFAVREVLMGYAAQGLLTLPTFEPGDCPPAG